MLKLTAENTNGFVANLVSNRKIRYAMEFRSLILRERRFPLPGEILLAQQINNFSVSTLPESYETDHKSSLMEYVLSKMKYITGFVLCFSLKHYVSLF